MIAWTIEAAIDSGLFDKVVVSTDSKEIAEVAIKYGAEVPNLRIQAADDFSPVSEATIHTLEQLEANGHHFDEVIQLFAVSPLRNTQDILQAYQFFQEQKANFLISCFKYVWMNPWWAVKLDNKYKPEWIFDVNTIGSKDLHELFCPTGAIWIANIKALKKSKSFYGPDYIFWEMDWKRALDIDNYDDIELGKALKSIS